MLVVEEKKVKANGPVVRGPILIEKNFKMTSRCDLHWPVLAVSASDRFVVLTGLTLPSNLANPTPKSNPATMNLQSAPLHAIER